MGGDLKWSAPEAHQNTGWRTRNLSIRSSSPYGLLPRDENIGDKVLAAKAAVARWAMGISDDVIEQIGYNAGELTE